MMRSRPPLPTLLDPHGATDPAEFFAVASEVFFEQPQRIAAEIPSLYAELFGFPRIDPREWALRSGGA